MRSSYHPVEADNAGQGHQAMVVNVIHVGDNKRTEYWWEAGPVDTCCCCWSLRTGVGILAILDVLAPPIWGLILIISGAKRAAHMIIAAMEDEFTSSCEGPSPTESEDYCLQLAEHIGTLRESDEEVSVPIALYVRAALSLVAGAIGLWAVLGSNAKVAKLYLWTWVPRYLVELITQFAYRAALRGSVLVNGFRLIVFVYYLKVVWSYQEVLQKRTLLSRSSEVSQGTGDFELNPRQFPEYYVNAA